MLSQKIKKHLIQLQQKKYRKEFQEFVIEGVKGVEEALKSDIEVILIVIEGSLRDEKEFVELIALAEDHDVPVEFCGRSDVTSIKSTDTFPGVLAIVAQGEVVLEDMTDGPIIVLDKINDPGNLGTIIRTADWFGLKQIILSEDCVDVYNPKVVRSTMGSLFHVNIFKTKHIDTTLATLKNNHGYIINALDMKGETISKLKSSQKNIYVFGSESHGVRAELDELIDNRYTIPGAGNTESLNVAVAAGILMSQLL